MFAIAGPLTRVLLRYFAGALLAKWALDANDPDVQEIAVFAVGAGCSIVSEGWYYLARKHGWHR